MRRKLLNSEKLLGGKTLIRDTILAESCFLATTENSYMIYQRQGKSVSKQSWGSLGPPFNVDTAEIRKSFELYFKLNYKYK